MYVNERIIENYLPEDAPEEMQPYTAYEYTGTERDGGCVVPAIDTTDVGQIANAIIRTRYAESDETAIHRHHMLLMADPTIEKAEEYIEEWNAYNAYAISAVETAKTWVQE